VLTRNRDQRQLLNRVETRSNCFGIVDSEIYNLNFLSLFLYPESLSAHQEANVWFLIQRPRSQQACLVPPLNLLIFWCHAFLTPAYPRAHVRKFPLHLCTLEPLCLNVASSSTLLFSSHRRLLISCGISIKMPPDINLSFTWVSSFVKSLKE